MVDLLELNLENIHPPCDGETYLTKGNFHYYHYSCDGHNDIGWGCGYRILQSICSWIIKNTSTEVSDVPDIPNIQKVLVKCGDKTLDFINSRDWIGSIEVGIAINTIFDIPWKISHGTSADILKCGEKLKEHFLNHSCPLMMGGDLDCESKAICGVHFSSDGMLLLILDPHCRRKLKSISALERENWIEWRRLDSFSEISFYNICFPLTGE